MRAYEILDQDDQRRRRTVADALAVLESQAAFGREDKAEIRVGTMSLVQTKDVRTVLVLFDLPGSEKSYAVPMPSAECFRGTAADDRRERHRIEHLDRGLVDANGGVRLANGATMRAVEVEPARLPLAPTELDLRIVHLSIACCWMAKDAPFTEREVRAKCYRSVRKAIRAKDTGDEELVPDLVLLDCGALSGLWVPSLVAIAAYWAEVYPGERVPSPQKIADTLADFRIRFPRHF